MSGYHSIARDLGHRPRRLPCFSGVSLLAAACLGCLVGIALTGIIGAAARQGEARPVNCLLRSPVADGVLPVSLASLSGICRVER